MPPKDAFRSLDHYAAHRCLCGHLCYQGWKPGDPCIACNCADHKPPEPQP